MSLLFLFSAVAKAAVTPPTAQDVTVAFDSLAPALEYGDLVLLQKRSGTLAQVTVFSVLGGTPEQLKAIVADPMSNAGMSESVKQVRVLSRSADRVHYVCDMSTAGGTTQMESWMTISPGNDIRITSTGGINGEFAWRFTPLAGNRTGVEYGLLIDMSDLGAFVKGLFKRTPGLKVGINATAGLMWMDGLRKLSSKKLGVPQRPAARRLPELSTLPRSQEVVSAVSLLARFGTVAWVGDKETMMMGHRSATPQEIRGRMTVPSGTYDMSMETPLKNVDVTVLQTLEADRIVEKVDGGESIDAVWSWRYVPVSDGTLVTMRTSMDPGKLWIMKLVLSIDPSVAPAVRLSAALNPWTRASL